MVLLKPVCIRCQIVKTIPAQYQMPSNVIGSTCHVTFPLQFHEAGEWVIMDIDTVYKT